MQAAVGSLLLITSTTMFTCIVIGIAAGVCIQTVENIDDMADQLSHLETSFSNQTINLFNQTQSLNLFEPSPEP